MSRSRLPARYDWTITTPSGEQPRTEFRCFGKERTPRRSWLESSATFGAFEETVFSLEQSEAHVCKEALALGVLECKLRFECLLLSISREYLQLDNRTALLERGSFGATAAA